MKTTSGSILAGAAMLMGLASTAEAADLRRGSLKDTYVPTVVDSPARWYMRIDGGFVSYDKPNMVYHCCGLEEEVITSRIDNTGSLGGGLGLYFSKNFRADVTYTHLFGTDVTGRYRVEVPGGCAANPCGGFVPSFNQMVRGVNELSSHVVLGNLYYDFDLRSHFTPYVGIGLGGVHHSVKAGSVVSDPTGPVTGTTAAYDNWHVAGALMGGFSVALRQNLHFDAGYRFLYLGETSTGALTVNRPANAAVTVANTPVRAGDDPTIEQIHAHEFRIGLRYDLR